MANRGDNVHNWTALHIAVIEDDVEKVRLLVSRGANVNARDRHGQIPMLRGDKLVLQTAENFVDQIEILKILVNAGSDLLSRDSKEVLQIANILSYGRRELVRIVMQSNADFSVNDGCRMTPLYCLSQNTCDGVVDEIRGKNFSFKSPGIRCKEENAIHTAIFSRNPKMFEFILENGQQSHTLDFSYCLTLGYVFPKAMDEIVELALEYKIDPWKNGMTLFSTIMMALFMDTGVSRPWLLDGLEQVVARLALQEINGTPNAKTLYFINAVAFLNLKNFYDLCKAELLEMKRSSICESMTYFQLLAAEKENIELYARDKELVARLRGLNDFLKWNKFYDRLIQRRLAMIFKIAVNYEERQTV